MVSHVGALVSQSVSLELRANASECRAAWNFNLARRSWRVESRPASLVATRAEILNGLGPASIGPVFMHLEFGRWLVPQTPFSPTDLKAYAIMTCGFGRQIFQSRRRTCSKHATLRSEEHT